MKNMNKNKPIDKVILNNIIYLFGLIKDNT